MFKLFFSTFIGIIFTLTFCMGWFSIQLQKNEPHTGSSEGGTLETHFCGEITKPRWLKVFVLIGKDWGAKPVMLRESSGRQDANRWKQELTGKESNVLFTPDVSPKGKNLVRSPREACQKEHSSSCPCSPSGAKGTYLHRILKHIWWRKKRH